MPNAYLVWSCILRCCLEIRFVRPGLQGYKILASEDDPQGGDEEDHECNKGEYIICYSETYVFSKSFQGYKILASEDDPLGGEEEDYES